MCRRREMYGLSFIADRLCPAHQGGRLFRGGLFLHRAPAARTLGHHRAYHRGHGNQRPRGGGEYYGGADRQQRHRLQQRRRLQRLQPAGSGGRMRLYQGLPGGRGRLKARLPHLHRRHSGALLIRPGRGAFEIGRGSPAAAHGRLSLLHRTDGHEKPSARGGEPGKNFAG